MTNHDLTTNKNNEKGDKTAKQQQKQSRHHYATRCQKMSVSDYIYILKTKHRSNSEIEKELIFYKTV